MTFIGYAPAKNPRLLVAASATLMTAGSIGLSFVSVHFDGQVSLKWVRTVGWIWAGSPEGARQVLSTIAGSMITVAGVAFSINIVALTMS